MVVGWTALFLKKNVALGFVKLCAFALQSVIFGLHAEEGFMTK